MFVVLLRTFCKSLKTTSCIKPCVSGLGYYCIGPASAPTVRGSSTLACGGTDRLNDGAFSKPEVCVEPAHFSTKNGERWSKLSRLFCTNGKEERVSERVHGSGAGCRLGWWQRAWRARWSERANDRSQCWHWNGLDPVCLRRCLVSSSDRANRH